MTPSITLAAMTAKIRPRLRFDCDPCRVTSFREPADLAKHLPGDTTLDDLKNRIVCRGCGMRVDGDMRRLEFLCSTTEDGHGSHGVEP